MARGIIFYSTENITWGEFYATLPMIVEKLGLEEVNADPKLKWVRFQKKDPEIEFDFSLANKGDDTAFLIDEEATRSHLPLQIAVDISMYSPAGMPSTYRPTLEILVAIAEKWPIIVSNGLVGAERATYTNEDLFQRLRNGQDIFP
jgi:hypothetical protein